MYLAIDTETTGVTYWDNPFVVSWARRYKGELVSGACVIGEFHESGIDFDIEEQELIFHNAKFDLRMLQSNGVLTEWDWFRIHDTECLSHLVNEQQPKALKRLAKDILGLETNEEEEIRTARRKYKIKKSDGYDKLPLEIVLPYAQKDAEYTLLLFEHFWPIVSGNPDLLEVYRQEQELMGVLYDMEAAGMGVDELYVQEQLKQLAGECLRLELSIRDDLGDEEFNPASPQQVIEVLRARGYKINDTSKATLSTLDDPLASAVLELRHKTKLKNTYFKSLAVETRNGIIHPNFKQWGPRGRRFSSGKVDD